MFRYLSSVCSCSHWVFPLNVHASSKVFLNWPFSIWLFWTCIDKYFPPHPTYSCTNTTLLRCFITRPHLKISTWNLASGLVMNKLIRRPWALHRSISAHLEEGSVLVDQVIWSSAAGINLFSMFTSLATSDRGHPLIQKDANFTMHRIFKRAHFSLMKLRSTNINKNKH
jgi:hypothetical protein